MHEQSHVHDAYQGAANGIFFFFNDTATTEIYTLSLHDALPISCPGRGLQARQVDAEPDPGAPRPVRHHGQVSGGRTVLGDRKSTRLNSSHTVISYAVFCLKQKSTGRSRPPS